MIINVETRLLSFADRHAIIDILESRNRIWGVTEWHNKPIENYKYRSMYVSHIFFGLFKDGVLDSFLSFRPFLEIPGAASIDMLISRKGSVKRKHLDNDYDIDITKLHAFAISKMIEMGFPGPYYARSSTRFKPMYKNPHNILSTYHVSIIEILSPGEYPTDPILRKYLGGGHPTEENEVRRFDKP